MLDHPKLSGWQPPSNYQPVPSTLEGITVFAPRPADVVVEEPTTYKCPQCGATTKYDIAAAGLPASTADIPPPPRPRRLACRRSALSSPWKHSARRKKAGASTGVCCTAIRVGPSWLLPKAP